MQFGENEYFLRNVLLNQKTIHKTDALYNPRRSHSSTKRAFGGLGNDLHKVRDHLHLFANTRFIKSIQVETGCSCIFFSFFSFESWTILTTSSSEKRTQIIYYSLVSIRFIWAHHLRQKIQAVVMGFGDLRGQ